MSVEAISWALNLAPVPADRRGQPSSACKFVLVGLANHAGPDGSGAFPSVATLVRYTGLSERTVRTCLDRLEAGGIIRPCDPDLVAARIKRADRRPQGWDLDLTLARDDLNEPGVTVPESQSPVRRAGLAPMERPHHERPPNGVQPPHPAGLMDHLDHEVQQLHLAAATRCNQRTGGVQPTRPRGAAVAPEPSTQPSLKPSAAPGPTRTRAAAAGGRGGRPADEFFAALPGAWMLTGEQRARLSPAAETALSSGWTPAALAAFTGANTERVRSPFAVLTARLSPAELPPPPGRAGRERAGGSPAAATAGPARPALSARSPVPRTAAARAHATRPAGIPSHEQLFRLQPYLASSCQRPSCTAASQAAPSSVTSWNLARRRASCGRHHCSATGQGPAQAVTSNHDVPSADSRARGGRHQRPPGNSHWGPRVVGDPGGQRLRDDRSRGWGRDLAGPRPESSCRHGAKTVASTVPLARIRI